MTDECLTDDRVLTVLMSVMTAEQRAQLRDIMRSDRPAMHQVLEELRAAHETLADRVFTPGALAASDLDPQLAQIAGLRDQLVQRALDTTLRVRALLTAEQLAEAAKRKERSPSSARRSAASCGAM